MASQQIVKLSMQAALRTLDIQERAVEQLRLRSGVLLAACSLIASIFGGSAIRANHGLGASGVVALHSNEGVPRREWAWFPRPHRHARPHARSLPQSGRRQPP
jgi:hypothetical protein